MGGIQPDSREGHSCDISDDGLMFVFGGDRHTMAFNDLHMINLSMNWTYYNFSHDENLIAIQLLRTITKLYILKIKF